MSTTVNHRALRQLPYRDGVVYGPIQSRRVGSSLGINLCPSDVRVCSFDCVYCQFPKPSPVPNWKKSGQTLLRAPKLLDVIGRGIRDRIDHQAQFDSITLSGNGDPSIHPDLLAVCRFLQDFVKQTGCEAVTTIFTDAAIYDDPVFIEALKFLDRRFIKLDAADEETFIAINRPARKIDLGDLARAMGQLDGVIIQTMVVSGLVDNRPSILTPRYAELVKLAGATEIQLCTIDKRPAYEGVLPLSERELNSFADDLRGVVEPVAVTVYYQDCPSGFPGEWPSHYGSTSTPVPR